MENISIEEIKQCLYNTLSNYLNESNASNRETIRQELTKILDNYLKRGIIAVDDCGCVDSYKLSLTKLPRKKKKLAKKKQELHLTLQYKINNYSSIML